MLDTGLAERVVVVTGANHGIGAAAARAFATQGARVFLHYLRLHANQQPPSVSAELPPGAALYARRLAQSAGAVTAAIRAAGGEAVAWEADLAEPAMVSALFDQAEAALGPVEVLVNNAAVGGAPKDTFLPLAESAADRIGRDLRTITTESHDRHFAVNSRATALMMAEFARRHVARGATWGRIINVSTDGASEFPEEVSYGASKYALESYSRSAARELGRYGITVNVVSPGPIQTGWMPPELEQRVVPKIPLGRVGQPEDVADGMILLAAEQARWITGQVLFVGGGHRMI
jgi:3-oxoacyl-[acyl-carrier protein] reductase